MTQATLILAGTAAAVGLGHALLGPDHYIPFIALSRARKWGASKTVLVTLACGLGHVLSSVVLGFIGIALGAAVFSLEAIEAFRGSVAAWFLIIFGFTYFVWGVRRALRSRPHEHEHVHQDSEVHSHTHSHSAAHSHVHAGKSGVTPWVLFIIFVFGPCEPLIPLVMYPAAGRDIATVVIVTAAFALATLAAMLGAVLVSYYGLSKISFPRFERYSHAMAGMAIFLCGGAVKFLGL